MGVQENNLKTIFMKLIKLFLLSLCGTLSAQTTIEVKKTQYGLEGVEVENGVIKVYETKNSIKNLTPTYVGEQVQTKSTNDSRINITPTNTTPFGTIDDFKLED
jgi:ribosomal protein S24E